MWVELQPGVFVADLGNQGIIIRREDPKDTLILGPGAVIKLVEFLEDMV